MKSVAPLLLRSRTRVFLVNLAEPDSEPTFFATLKWNPDGLIPAIVQDAESGEVLMMAWMDELSLKTTMTSGQTHFYSRSRRLHWHKGESSGHVQNVVSIHVDCDADVILIKARQVGGACHEGFRSCFFRKLDQNGSFVITETPVFFVNDVYGSK